MNEPDLFFGLSITAFGVMVIRPRREDLPCGPLITAHLQAALAAQFGLLVTEDTNTRHTVYSGEYAGYPIKLWSYDGKISLMSYRDVPSEQEQGIKIAQQGVLEWFIAFLQFVSRDREFGDVKWLDGSQTQLQLTPKACLLSRSPLLVKAFLGAALREYEKQTNKPGFADAVFARVAQWSAQSSEAHAASGGLNLTCIAPRES